MGRANCEFLGTGRQYLLPVYVHLFLLTILTLGIYAPWAWVRIFRLKASHMRINGGPVLFTGTGGQLLVLALVTGLLTVVTLGLYGAWAVCRFFDWKARHTMVEGQASRFTGTGGAFLGFYLLHLVLLPMLTLGIYYFWAVYRLYAWKEEHTRYGGEQTSFGAGFGDFLKIALITWVLNLVTLNLFTPWALCMFYRWQIGGLTVGAPPEAEHFPPVRTNWAVAAALVAIGLLPLAGVGYFAKSGLEQLGSRGERVLTPGVVQRHQRAAHPLPRQAVSNRQGAVGSMPQEDYAREFQELEALIRMGRKNADALYNRAILYDLMGDSDQALADYNAALAIDRRHADAYFNRALLFARRQQLTEALQDLDQAIKLDPQAADAYCNRGNVQFERGMPDEALRDFASAVRLAPEDGDAYYNQGLAYLQQGRMEDARQAFEKAHALGQVAAGEQLTGPALVPTPDLPPGRSGP